MSTATISLSDSPGTPSVVAFGGLIDLARLQVGTASAEICDACSTLNIASARYCKCCSHKLPAFYASTEDGMERLRVREATLLPWHSLGMPDRASVMDFAAFSVVISLLVVLTASISIP